MSHRTGGLHIHFAEISGGCEFVEQREQPFVVFEEDFLPHDEHIAERRGTPTEHGVGIHFVIGMTCAQNVIHVAQILQSQMPIGVPMLLEIRESADSSNVVQRRGDDVPAVHCARDRIVVDTVFGERVVVDIRVDDFAVIVFLMRGVGEIEIPAVMGRSRNSRRLRSSSPYCAVSSQ